MPGRLVHPIDTADFDDPPRVHDRDMRRNFSEKLQIVSYIDHGEPGALPNRFEQIDDLPLRRHIESCCRLVKHDEIRRAGDRHGNSDALLLAAGQLVGKAIQKGLEGRKPDLAKQQAGALARARARRFNAVLHQQLDYQ